VKISARARENLRTCAEKSPHVCGKISARVRLYAVVWAGKPRPYDTSPPNLRWGKKFFVLTDDLSNGLSPQGRRFARPAPSGNELHIGDMFVAGVKNLLPQRRTGRGDNQINHKNQTNHTNHSSNGPLRAGRTKFFFASEYAGK
jgi:hypothetical protein